MRIETLAAKLWEWGAKLNGFTAGEAARETGIKRDTILHFLRAWGEKGATQITGVVESGKRGRPETVWRIVGTERPAIWE